MVFSGKKEYIGIFCFLQPNVYHATNLHSCLLQVQMPINDI
jgi:hypothetical protein